MSVERSDSERVVITGMGWVTPLGHDLETVWKRLMAADSGMAPVTRFDAATFPTTSLFTKSVTSMRRLMFWVSVALSTIAATVT